MPDELRTVTFPKKTLGANESFESVFVRTLLGMVTDKTLVNDSFDIFLLAREISQKKMMSKGKLGTFLYQLFMTTSDDYMRKLEECYEAGLSLGFHMDTRRMSRRGKMIQPFCQWFIEGLRNAVENNRPDAPLEIYLSSGEANDKRWRPSMMADMDSELTNFRRPYRVYGLCSPVMPVGQESGDAGSLDYDLNALCNFFLLAGETNPNVRLLNTLSRINTHWVYTGGTNGIRLSAFHAPLGMQITQPLHHGYIPGLPVLISDPGNDPARLREIARRWFLDQCRELVQLFGVETLAGPQDIDALIARKIKAIRDLVKRYEKNTVTPYTLNKTALSANCFIKPTNIENILTDGSANANYFLNKLTITGKFAPVSVLGLEKNTAMEVEGRFLVPHRALEHIIRENPEAECWSIRHLSDIRAFFAEYSFDSNLSPAEAVSLLRTGS